MLYSSITLLVGGGVLLFISARKVRELKKQRLSLTPTFGPGGGGMALTGRF